MITLDRATNARDELALGRPFRTLLHRIVEETWPLLHAAVTGDDEASPSTPTAGFNLLAFRTILEYRAQEHRNEAIMDGITTREAIWEPSSAGDGD